MEIQLQELIDQIRQDGVAAAQAQADSIVEAAKKQAEAILSDAQARADGLAAQARAENERLVRASEEAIRQAGRNLLISFRESVCRELAALVNSKVEQAYSSDEFGQILARALESWAARPDAGELTVLLNGEDLEKLEGMLLAELKDHMRAGVTLQASDRFDGGFRIAAGDGGIVYDFSAPAVVDMLSNYLSPRVTELLKEGE